jgi:hypothetical protein
LLRAGDPPSELALAAGRAGDGNALNWRSLVSESP